MDKMHCPVPGTAVLIPVDRATGWAKTQPDVQFAGYLVTARRVADPSEGAVARGQ
ncbi:DUF6578 domain-containing protein [Streptomyces globisporus]|uniref:DUF6578 domain-containing protein n=1 Tax=Streptomyces globisporus TaxID=1908 RepID=UPI003692F24E